MNYLKRYPLYFSLTLADLISDFGDMVFYLALLNYIVSLPDAKVAIAVVTLSEMVPNFTALLMGAWADRTPQKLRAIWATILLRMGIYLVVGLLMGFSPALWVVYWVAGLNFLSDLSGQYESGLFAPLSVPLVADQDREGAIAVSQTLKQFARVGFQALSAFLVSVLTYQTLALANAATFALAGVILFIVRRPLAVASADTPRPTPTTSNPPRLSLIQQLRQLFANVRQHPDVVLILTIAPFLNALLSTLTPLLLVLINQDSHFAFISSQWSIATTPLLMTIGALVGSLLAVRVFRQLSLVRFLQIIVVVPILLFVAFLVHQILLIWACTFVLAILAMGLSPKLSAILMNTLPRDALGTTFGALNTLLTAGIGLMNITVSTLIVTLPVDLIFLLGVLLSGSLALYTFWTIHRKGLVA